MVTTIIGRFVARYQLVNEHIEKSKGLLHNVYDLSHGHPQRIMEDTSQTSLDKNRVMREALSKRAGFNSFELVMTE